MYLLFLDKNSRKGKFSSSDKGQFLQKNYSGENKSTKDLEDSIVKMEQSKKDLKWTFIFIELVV